MSLDPTAWWIGPYRIEGELARGGMGVVYRAVHTELNRAVAIKVQRPGAPASETERFRIEAQAAARLRHPNIAGIHEVGALPNGQPFLVMDLIQGGSLKQRLDEEGPLPLPDCARLISTLARAVSFAHAHNILHRDIKPANVLLNPEGAPVLTDFGLAKQVDDEAGITVSGQIMGTPSYMPPEQANGATELIDRRADIYSLGATLYALITGEAPFRGDSAIKVVAAVLTRPPVPPSKLRAELDRDLETVCLRCLEKEPDQRYPTALALAEDLERYLDGEPIEARPVGRLERLGRRVRKRPGLVAGLGVGMLLVIGVLGLTLANTKAAELKALEQQGIAEKQRGIAEDETDKADRLRLEADAARRMALAQARLERGYGFLGRSRFEQAALTFARAAALLPDRRGQADVFRAVAHRGAAEALQRFGLEAPPIRGVRVGRFLPGGSGQVVLVGWKTIRLGTIDERGELKVTRSVSPELLRPEEAKVDPSGKVLAIAHSAEMGLPREARLAQRGLVTFWDLPALTYRGGIPPVSKTGTQVARSLDFRSDGRELIYMVRDQGVVSLVDVASLRVVRSYRSIDRPLSKRYAAAGNSCAFSPSGQLLVAGYRDGTLSVWGRDGSHRFFRNLRGDSPRHVWFLEARSTGGRAAVLFAGEEHGKVGTIAPNQPPGRPLLDGRDGAVTGADLELGDQVRPDLLAVATADGGLRVLSAPGGAEIGEFKVEGRDRTHCSISPQRDRVMVSAHNRARLFDLRRVQTFRGDGPIAVDAAGARVAMLRLKMNRGAVVGYAIDVWDLAARQRVRRLEVANAAARVKAVALSPDGKRIGVGIMPWSSEGGEGWTRQKGGYDPDAGELILVDLTTGAHRKRPTQQPYALSMSAERVFVGVRRGLGGGARPRGRITAVGPAGGAAQHMSWHIMTIRDLAQAPGGGWASGSDDGTVALWDAKGRLQRVLDMRLEGRPIPGRSVPAIDGENQPLDVSDPSQNRTAQQIVDRFMEVTQRGRDLRTSVAARRTRDTWGVRSVAFSRDGKLLVTGSGDARARVWVVETGALKARIDVETAVVGCGFLGDGRLALATRGGSMQVWELKLDEAINPPKADDPQPHGGHLLRRTETGSQIKHAAVGGDTFVVACEDSTVWTWDLTAPTDVEGFDASPVDAVTKRLWKE